MKIHVFADEWYPFYTLNVGHENQSFYKNIDIPEDLFFKFNNTVIEMENLHSEIEKYIDYVRKNKCANNNLK